MESENDNIDLLIIANSNWDHLRQMDFKHLSHNKQFQGSKQLVYWFHFKESSTLRTKVAFIVSVFAKFSNVNDRIKMTNSKFL